MLPAEGRQVLQEIFIDCLASILDCLYGPFQIDGVPEHDSGGHQIKAGGAIALVLKAAVAHFAEPVEEHGPGQGVAGLAFIQTGVNATAKLDVLQPVEREQGPFNPPQLP